MKVLPILALALALPVCAVVPVTYTDQSGSTQTNRPNSVPMTFKQGDVANFPRPTVAGTPVTTWQSDVKTRWPDGSVKFAIVSFLNTIASSGAIAIDFVNSANPCSSGNQAACDAAALSIAQMKAFQETSGGAADGWNVQIEATASSITKTFNARTILNACGSISLDASTLGCRYWLRGPVRTAVILEDRSSARAYDAGWACTSCSPPYSGTTWTSDATHKSLHPTFIVEFWAGTANVQFSTISLENMWSTHLQDQAYALTIKTGGTLATTAYTKAYFPHYYRTRWRKSFWNAAAPGVVKANLNLAYMASTGAIPNFDLSKAPSVSGDNTSFAGSDKCDINGHGLFDQAMGDTGGRPELGIIPGWYVRAMYTMDPTAVANMLLMSDCYGSVQENIRESNTGLFYDSAHAVDAFGRTFSVDAHANGGINGITFPTVGSAGISPVFTGFNLAHQAGFSFVPYLFSGDYYTLESLQLQAANDIANTDPTTLAYGRNGAMGIINGRAQQLRGQAWGWRDLIQATFASVDGTPESAYLNQKLANNIGQMEGWYNITSGAYNGTAAWLWGRNVEAVADPNPLRFPQWPDQGAGSLGWLQSTVQYMESPLEFHFLTVAIGSGAEMGYPFQKVQQVYAAVPLNIMLNPGYNKWLIGAYRIPEFYNSNQFHFATTWPAVLAGYSTSPTNYQTITQFPVQDMTDCNAGFTQYAHASTSFLTNITLLPADGSYTGAAAWAWIDAPAQQISTQPCLSANPMWAFLPRSLTPTVPTLTSTSPLPNGTTNVAYSYQFSASGTQPITWSGTSIPTGLTLSASGLLSGTPTVAAANTLAITATNAQGSAGPTNFSLTILSIPPTITSTSPLPTVVVGTPYSYQFTASGTTPITWTATGLPAWATLSTGGVLSGTPNVSGTNTLAVTATNAVAAAGPTNFTLSTLQAPTINTVSPLPTGTNGTAYSVTFTAAGSTPITWSATGLPSWAAFSPAGVLSGTPNANATTVIAVTASNSVGNAGPTNFSLTVNPVATTPVITSTSPLPGGVVGTAYSVQLAGTGSPMTWTATGLPGWASLSTGGLLTGTPNAAAVSTIAVTLTNSAGVAGPTNFSLTVLAQPAITSASPLPNGGNGIAYSFQFAGTGSTPITWTHGINVWPAWASLSSSGLMTGTPNVNATSAFSVFANNAAGQAIKDFSITVTTITTPPTITSSSPITQGQVGAAYSYQFTATGTTPISWTATGLPAWASFNTSTGTITGTPNAVATSTVAVTATNAAGSDGPHNYSLPVIAAAVNFSMATEGPHHVVVGHNLYFNVITALTAGVDESVTPAVSGLPANTTSTFPKQIRPGGCCGTTLIGLNGSNPVMVATTASTPVGTYTLTVTYTTASSVVHSINYQLIVDPVPAPLTLSAFPANVPLTNLATWQANMITYGQTYCQVPALGPSYEGFPWYYDGTRVYYQIADYTGDPQYLTCARNLDALMMAYALQLAPTWSGTAGNIPGWHAFTKGLAMGYLRDGVAADKTAILAIQSQGYANVAAVENDIHWFLSREMSYAVEADHNAESVGQARDPVALATAVDILIGHMDQWFQSQTANYVQPFMVALAVEALRQYWEATADPRIPPLVKMAADQLWSVSFDSLTNSLMYYNYNASLGPPPPQPYTYDAQCSNYASFSVTCKGPSPDLNMLIVPIFGWAYQLTGQQVYRDHGDILFNAGASGAFLGAGKQFSQNYRWSGKYVAWRDAPLAPPVAPTITTSTPLPSSAPNIPYAAAIAASGDTPITWSITAGTVCTGLTLDGVTGILAGTPTVPQTCTFTVQAANPAGTNAKVFALTIVTPVVPPTVITQTPLPAGATGNAYTTTIVATGDAPLTWSIASGTLCAGLTLDAAAGTIAGTPSTVQTCAFTVQAANVAGTDSRAFTLTIAAPVPPPIITTTALPSGPPSVAYSTTIAATGAQPITWAITAGTLCTGLNLNTSTGAIAGTPTVTQTCSFTVRATNSAGTNNKTFSITIVASAVPPTITTSALLPAGSINRAYAATIAATGATPITWSITAGGLPAGFTFDPTTGIVTGSTAAVGIYPFTVRAQNAAGSNSRSFSVTVGAQAIVTCTPSSPQTIPLSWKCAF